LSKKFNDFRLREELSLALEEAEFDTPTPIQEKAIPVLLGGQDLIGVAETGTGKTLAFLLPIFQALESGHADPQGLVICPTRELAIQVGAEATRFGERLGVRTVVAYGGTSSGDQKRALVAGVDLVVGTPGRLLDFVNSAWLSLRKLRHVVLDEADRMLDMGFIDDVDAILRRTPMSRQTMLFSATIPDEIRKLADRYMIDPETVRTHRGTRVTQTVDHAFYPVNRNQKGALLVEVLRREKPAKTLIFTATREGTSEIALLLRRQRHEVVSLSSLLSVAARGLDITDIDLVVNYDVPMQAEDYVHRIGRTGRAERTGRAVTIVCELDGRRVAEIERLLGYKVARVELEGFDYRPMGAAPAPRRGRPGDRRPRGRSGGGDSSGRRGGGRKPGGRPRGGGRSKPK